MKLSSAVVLALLGQHATAFTGGKNRPLHHSHLNQADVAANPEDVGQAVKGEKLDDLKTLALELNPVIPYYDPLKLAQNDFTGQGDEATIGWLREAEIKHGRVAMAAFVGYMAQANGILFNFAKTFPDIDANPPNQWDALPYDFRLTLILLVGIFEFAGEYKGEGGEAHYMRGGKPGLHIWFPKFPRKEEDKRLGRLKEINNGRLAMLGIFGFVSESVVPGSVPLLNGRIPAYTGNIWNPFEKEFVFAIPEQPENVVQVSSSIDISNEVVEKASTDVASNLFEKASTDVASNLIEKASSILDVATESVSSNSELTTMLQDMIYK